MGLKGSVVLLALCGPGAMAAQTTTASDAIAPSLQVMKTALDGVRVDRWKGSAAMRGEAETNLESIRRDVLGTLPPLLASADAAPGSMVKLLPAYRNVEALYDVLLRVDAAARMNAPIEQASALDQALNKLDDGRRALGDLLNTDAAATEKKAGDLQAKLAAIPPPVPPAPAPVCPAPAPTKKKAKAAAKPSAAASPATH